MAWGKLFSTIKLDNCIAKLKLSDELAESLSDIMRVSSKAKGSYSLNGTYMDLHYGVGYDENKNPFDITMLADQFGEFLLVFNDLGKEAHAEFRKMFDIAIDVTRKGGNFETNAFDYSSFILMESQ